jgi:formyltetrahydrofolate deformylase
MTATETHIPAPQQSTTVEHVLTLDCPESPGIVHAVSSFLLEHGCDIIDNKQFGERSEGHFFMRVHFASDGDASTADTLRAAFAPVAEKFAMRWQLERQGAKRKVLIMVSKFGHCLNDLLFRARIGELPMEVVAVVSNHTDHQALAEWHGIPFHHIPVTADTKPQAEARLLELVDELDVELVVLARYMQVLSDELTRKLDGRAINIHHSFLPSFKGAKPYHQAYARGVKTVGATAHYVNAELDEGPIIAQQVVEVDHTY